MSFEYNSNNNSKANSLNNLAEDNSSLESQNISHKDTKNDPNKLFEVKINRSKSADYQAIKPNKDKREDKILEKSYAKPTQSFLNNTNKIKEQSTNSMKTQKNKNYKKIAKQAKRNQPLLGFDWAIGKFLFKINLILLIKYFQFIDSIQTKKNVISNKIEKPDEFWDDLSKFRIENSEDCISSKKTNFNNTITSFLESGSNSFIQERLDGCSDDDGRNHKCNF